MKQIVACHESFVTLGKKSKLFPFACIWHEGVNGRNKEDLISTFYAFLLSNRDANTMTIKLDNSDKTNLFEVKAKGLIFQIKTFEFIFSMHIIYIY